MYFDKEKIRFFRIPPRGRQRRSARQQATRRATAVVVAVPHVQVCACVSVLCCWRRVVSGACGAGEKVDAPAGAGGRRERGRAAQCVARSRRRRLRT